MAFILILVGGLFVDHQASYYVVGGLLGISIGTIYGFVLKGVIGTSSEDGFNRLLFYGFIVILFGTAFSMPGIADTLHDAPAYRSSTTTYKDTTNPLMCKKHPAYLSGRSCPYYPECD